MIQIDIPGHKIIKVKHLVLDYNGTIATDGQIIKGVESLLTELSLNLKIHILTADTFGTATEELKRLPVKIKILEPGKEDKQKLEYLKSLGQKNIIAVGNGKNDLLMLKKAALSIGIINTEGASSKIINVTDIICKNIVDALSLFIYTKRLSATLRN